MMNVYIAGLLFGILESNETCLASPCVTILAEKN